MSELKYSSLISDIDIESMWIAFAQLAKKHGACSLASGTPDIPAPSKLKEFLVRAVDIPACNWYAPPGGHGDLVSAIIERYSTAFNGLLKEESQVQVCVGAYQAIHFVYQSFLQEGDEVVCFEPYFDCYTMNALTTKCSIVFVQLQIQDDRWVLNKEAFLKAVSPKTKMIILNTPHNPTGKVFTREELEVIAEVCRANNLLVLADEVYDCYTYSHNHVKIATLPGMWDRTITVHSAGKMYGVTGWRVGWAVGPSRLIRPLKLVCVCDNFCIPTLLQDALANMLRDGSEDTPRRLADSYLRNMTRLSKEFHEMGFNVLLPEGSYFMVIEFTSLSETLQNMLEEEDTGTSVDVRVSNLITRRYKLCMLPLSLFYSPRSNCPKTLLRVTFAKCDETIDTAIQCLHKMKADILRCKHV